MSAESQKAPATPFSEHLPEGTELLLGQYRITKYLNSGGFGITYLAVDSLERTVVVKECFPGAFCRRDGLLVQARTQQHVAELEAVVGLFLREARALSKLQHPNIVGVHQVFEFNNTAYMALDFIEGRDLLQLVNSPGRSLTPRQIRSILEKLLSAVGAVHEAGLLHRDISPDNVIVTADYDPIMIDFGAARDQATKATQALSALRVVKDGYSPQEFYLAGSGQGPFSDLYSLAATFYHVITGEVPPDSQRRLSAHVAGDSDPYIPLREKTSAYDVAFCDALDRAMAILPKDRIQNAETWRRMMNETPEPKKRSSLINRSVPIAISKPRTGSTTPAASRPTKPVATPTPKPAPKAKAKAASKRGKAPLMLAGAALAMVAAGVFFAPQQDETAAVAVNPGPTGVADTAMATADATATDAPLAERGEPVADAAAVASPDPSPLPALAPLPSDAPNALDDLPGDLADGRVTLNWHVTAPFSVDADGIVTDVSGPQAGPIAPGWQVTEIGGVPFDPSVELDVALRAAAHSEDGRSATILVAATSPGDAATTISRVEAPLTYKASIGADLEVETKAQRDGWQSHVVAAPSTSALRAGDEVVAIVGTGDRLQRGDAMARAAADGVEANSSALKVAVRRDGLMWSADLPLPAAQD